MINQQLALILVCAGALAFMGMIIYLSSNYNLNRIKSRTVGDGQHGTARWATKAEIWCNYRRVAYRPKQWRKGERAKRVMPIQRVWSKGADSCDVELQKRRNSLPQGVIVGSMKRFGKTTALVDTGDVHVLMIGAAGVGKTACFLIPNIEYACACGMSFLSTDIKADIYRNCAGIAKDCYGYNVSIIDLRNPTRSDGFNMLHLVNRYTDMYKAAGGITNRAKAEKYAKIIAKTIVFSDGGDSSQYGPNSYFYDAAEGLLTAVILIVLDGMRSTPSAW